MVAKGKRLSVKGVSLLQCYPLTIQFWIPICALSHLPLREEENDVPVPKGNLGSRILEAQKSGVNLLVTIQSVMGEEAAVNVKIE